MSGTPPGISRSTITAERREISRDELRTLSTTSMTGSSRWWARTTRALRSSGGTPPCQGAVRHGAAAVELVELQTCDLLPHPVAPQFGRYAVVRVRWGKRSKGGTFRTRGVQMVLEWVVEALRVYVEDIRPVFPDGPWLWPSERRDSGGGQQPIGVLTYQAAFAAAVTPAALMRL